MIQGIPIITILVHDQDEALAFFTEKLGLETQMDVMAEAGFRWLTIAPVDRREPQLTLVPADTDEKRAQVGRQVADHVLAVFQTDDCQRDYELLKSRGVHFRSEPEEQPWGMEAVFEDLYGNRYDLHEPR